MAPRRVLLLQYQPTDMAKAQVALPAAEVAIAAALGDVGDVVDIEVNADHINVFLAVANVDDAYRRIDAVASLPAGLGCVIAACPESASPLRHSVIWPPPFPALKVPPSWL